ncbi:MAG: amidase family protein [Beijerinckiaceae bacterium]
MASDDPLLSPVAEQIRLLAERRLSASELLQLTLQRIDRLNPAVNAVIALDAERAAIAARESDRRLAEGTARPLEGLPVTIKDAFDTAGLRTACGAPNLKDRVPDEDAVAVARLRAAGAIIVGKTNVPAFCGDFQSASPISGKTSNPWNLDLSAGGSSGGAAAAVATGMASFEIGTDQGGSTRWPCAANGVTGLKSSWGLISTWGVVPPPPEKRTARNVDVVSAGPITRHASDMDLILPILAGPRDVNISGPVLPTPRRMSPQGLRVAVWVDEPMAPADGRVRDGVRAAAGMLAAEGAVIDERARPSFRFEEAYEVFALLNHWLVGYGLPARVRDKIASRASSYAPGDLSHAALQARGMLMTPGLYQELNARRMRLKRQWAQFFTRFDVVLCPPAPVAFLPHQEDPNVMARTLDVDGEARPYLDFLHWASLAAGCDLPAATGPAGFTPEGMPRGVQIIAPMLEDRTAIAVAGMLQELQGGFRPPPM